MQKDISFIDDFIKNKIKNYKIKPSREWREMQNYIKQKGVKSITHDGSSGLRGIKNESVIISLIAVLSVSVFLVKSSNENKFIPVKKSEKIKIIPVSKSYFENDTLSNKFVTEENNNVKSKSVKKQNEQVKIKVKVPVHKTVVVKKHIYLKDSVKNK